ncbi:probable folate-biopterin transporter 8, chloroplastic isoform X1 [Jatropha curcas]|nr:probable folate-biopterin transporter 8, chloroplastic isoform X1 [Jatropha curcas]
MISSSTPTKNPIITIIPKNLKLSLRPQNLSRLHLRSIQCSFQNQNPNTLKRPANPKTHLFGVITPGPVFTQKGNTRRGNEENRGFAQVGSQQMAVLCGFGYWVQGFRCFPWLALNFHMANNLNLQPLTLQLVQHCGNLPMVAKPLYGILSDAIYIGGAHRIPYILIGVLLQILSWGPLAFIPLAREALPILLACILLGNLGASVAEVAKDALVAEYGQKHKIRGLQSYSFMALAVGGILGNLLGGYFLMKAPPKNVFLIFSYLLSIQFAISLTAREVSLGLSRTSDQKLAKESIWENITKKLSDLKMALGEDIISRPLTWIVASIAAVPVLSGSIFCYQTQCLNLDPSIIGMSKVIGQLMLLSLTVLYDRYWKGVPMRKLIASTQVLYASSLLLDVVLVRQINLRVGIPNDVFVCCFSGLAETLAQFKLLPFSVLLASLCPKGCEGSLTSFLASTLCLSSIVSGFLGVGLASLMGITAGDYSRLPVGILIQFILALLPLGWIHYVPSQSTVEKNRKRGISKRSRKVRRIGRVVLGSIYFYRRERESEAQG